MATSAQPESGKPEPGSRAANRLGSLVPLGSTGLVFGRFLRSFGLGGAIGMGVGSALHRAWPSLFPDAQVASYIGAAAGVALHRLLDALIEWILAPVGRLVWCWTKILHILALKKAGLVLPEVADALIQRLAVESVGANPEKLPDLLGHGERGSTPVEQAQVERLKGPEKVDTKPPAGVESPAPQANENETKGKAGDDTARMIPPDKDKSKRRANEKSAHPRFHPSPNPESSKSVPAEQELAEIEAAEAEAADGERRQRAI